MTDVSASTPYSEAVKGWASDWADAYAQDWPVERMTELLWKHVETHAEVNGEPKGVTGYVIGYSRDVIVFTPEEGAVREEVYRSSLILDIGKSIPIFAGAEVKICAEEEAEDEG